MKRKKSLIAGIAVIVIAALAFVGYSIYRYPAMFRSLTDNTFLESYNLTGKLIIPFCTSGGSDIDETMPTFLNSCDGLAVYGERRISGTSQLDGWLTELGLNEMVMLNQ